MSTRTTHPDRGSVLLLVLVLSVGLFVMVAGISTFITTDLSYGKVVEARADRLAAADGGMRYAVERLQLGASRICATSGGDAIDPPDINGATVTVTCGQIGNGFDNTNGWALILTAEDIPFGSAGCTQIVDGDSVNTCALIRTKSGASVTKLVGGPVYMERLDFDVPAPIQFRYSQLLYTSSDCTATPTLPPNVTFDSTSLGLACTPRPWSRAAHTNGLFSAPNIGPLPTNLNPPAITDGNGCRVFEPGRYTIAPVLGSHNYFKSGNYLFDGFTLEVKSAKVTAGRAAADGTDGAAQFIPNTTCNSARNSDTNGVTSAGVTFYLKNGARFKIDAQGTLEIMRRKQGKSYVGIHLLDHSLTWNQDVINQGPGSNKDMAIHGLVWAPTARVTFREVSNTANGQLLGGAVLSSVDLRSSASATGFVVAVEPSDLHGKLQLDSIATLDGDETRIRSIIDYRPSTNYTAVTSWRVVD